MLAQGRGAARCCSLYTQLDGMAKRTSRSAPSPTGKWNFRPPPGRQLHPRHWDLWAATALLGIVLLAYGQVLHFDFVNFDDQDYVTANPNVQAGLTWPGVAWAFRTSFTGNWFPLTWLSHMTDCELFGLDAGWHHFTSVVIHALTTVLLFWFLKSVTASYGRSAVAAFLFAIHPLRVESVAWVAERKDVLCGLFWVLTIWSYSAFAARPSRWRYALTLVLFCLGLMTKPMMVTLPLVLCLLDLWPLRRGIRLVEKLPLLAISLGVSVITYAVHREVGATAASDIIPLLVRLENALVSYIVYVLNVFWPVNLAVYYPYPRPWETLLVPAIIAGTVLILLTVLAVRTFVRWPHFAVGWFWYLVTLVPVIGIVQVGGQSRADRYTYIPAIGLTIAFVWGGSELLRAQPRICACATAAICALSLVLTIRQVQYWRDSVSLYQRAIAVTSGNYLAHFNLAKAFDTRGETAQAAEELRKTVHLRPNLALAHAELGQILARQGQSENAVEELRQAVSLDPGGADSHFRLGSVLGLIGRADDAVSEFQRGLELEPNNADAHYNLGVAYARSERTSDAEREFAATLRLRPEDGDAHLGLGIILARAGRIDESIQQLSEAVRLKPEAAQPRQALQDVLDLKKKLDNK